MFLGPQQTDRVSARRRRWRLAAMVAAVLALLAASGLLLPEAGLRWGLVEALQRLGMAEVQVSDTDVSLFGGRVVVHRIEAKPHVGLPFGLKALDLVMRWKPLLDRRLSVESLDLDGLSIAIRRDPDGSLVVNGLPLPAAGGSGGGTLWGFGVDSVRLSNSTLRYSDAGGTLVLDIQSLAVDAVHSWNADAPVHVRLAGRLDGAPIEVSGTLTPFAAQPRFTLAVTAESLDLAHLGAMAGRHDLSGHLRLLSTVTGEVRPAGVAMTVEGGAGLDGGALALPGAKVAAKELDWHGRIAFGPNLAAAGGPNLAAAGTLTAHKLAVTAGDVAATADSVTVESRKLEQSAAGVNFAGDASASGLVVHGGFGDVQLDSLALSAQALDWRAREERVEWRGGLTAGDGRVAVAGITAQPGRLTWQGNTSIALAAGTVHLEGRAEDDVGKVDTGSLQVEHRHADAEGSLDLALHDPAMSASLAINAAGIAVHDSSRDLLALDSLQATDLRLAPGRPVTVAMLEARSLGALRRTAGKTGTYPWRAEAAHIRLDRGVLAADGGISAGALAVDGLLLRLVRTKTGFVGLETSGEPAADGASALPRLAVGRLVVSGGSRINFVDRALEDPVRLKVSDIQASVSGLDTAAAERDCPFDVKARIGGATVAASGTVRPFAPSLTGSLQGKVTAFELPPLSPYADQALGVQLQTGHFDGDLAVKADGGALDGKVDLQLSNLFVAQPDPNAPVARQAKMPVATLLDLLRDSQDDIRLSIPISGNLSDPQFDVSDAVAQAVGGAMRSAALTTLEVLFPVAAIIDLATSDNGMSLEPLPFKPGDGDLDDGQHGRLDAVAALLRNRPGLTLSLCGTATVEADWPVLLERRKNDQLGVLYKLQKLVHLEAKPDSTAPDADALSRLAGSRADAIKAWLTGSAGIAPSRLYSCLPAVEPKGAPRVKLKL